MSSAVFLISAVLVVFAGMSVALQQVLNANLREHIGSPWWAGFMSYLVGVAVMLVIALATTPISKLTNALNGGTSWFIWFGGLFGAIFIAVCILMVPKLGAATTLALIVVGQMLGALAFDHFGILGLPEQPATLIRLAGAGCLIFGVVLIRM
ncbi:MAG: DMT family transporter [Fluviibacter sp.]